MEELLKAIKALPKEYVKWIIFDLMKDDVITFHEIAEEHAHHMEMLKKAEFKAYTELQARTTELFYCYKKDRDEKIKDIMRYLKDKGRINITDEQIDGKWK